jgi:hypothetical protein
MLQDKQILDRAKEPTFKLVPRGPFYTQLRELYQKGVRKVCNTHALRH